MTRVSAPLLRPFRTVFLLAVVASSTHGLLRGGLTMREAPERGVACSEPLKLSPPYLAQQLVMSPFALAMQTMTLPFCKQAMAVFTASASRK